MAMLKQNENGIAVADLCREHGLSQAQFQAGFMIDTPVKVRMWKNSNLKITPSKTFSLAFCSVIAIFFFDNRAVSSVAVGVMVTVDGLNVSDVMGESELEPPPQEANNRFKAIKKTMGYCSKYFIIAIPLAIVVSSDNILGIITANCAYVL